MITAKRNMIAKLQDFFGFIAVWADEFLKRSAQSAGVGHTFAAMSFTTAALLSFLWSTVK